MLEEFRQALRGWRRNWPSTAAILLMVALGAGASGAAVSVITGILVNPLGVPAPDRLVTLSGVFPDLSGDPPTTASFLDYKPLLRGFDDLAAYSKHDGGANLVFDERVVRTRGAEVTPTFFETLGVGLERGRSFRPEERHSGRNRVIIIGEGLRRRIFGEVADPVGRTVQVNDIAFTVIGVAPGGLRFPSGAEFWIPISLGSDRVFRGQAVSYGIFGRLSPISSVSQAQSDLRFFAQAAAAVRPGSWAARREITIVPLSETIVGNARRSLQILALALALVWLAAVANIAVLLLARTAARQTEMAVRWALGASPRRFVRHFVADGVLLSVTSLAVGLLAAYVSLGAITGLLPQGYGGAAAPEPATPVLWLVILISVFTGLVALIPVLRISGTDNRSSLIGLRDGSRTGSRLSHRRWLVVAQVGIATILLAGTIAMARSLAELQKTDLGFDPTGSLAFNVSSPMPQMRGSTPRAAVYDPLLSRIRQMPGVSAAGATTALPLRRSDVIGTLYSVAGAPEPKAFRDRFALQIGVTPGYLQAVGARVLEGRAFDDHDSSTTPPVAIVNQALAVRYGGPEGVLGKRITLAPRNTPLEVVGVIDDVRLRGVTIEPMAQVYLPHTQQTARLAAVVVRAPDRGPELARDLRATVAGIDPSLVVYEVASLDEVVRAATAPQRTLSMLFTVFAAIALVLSGVAAYAIVTQYVTENRRDIGVRRALGAAGGDIAALVLRQGVKPAVFGVVIGTACTAGLLRIGSAGILGLEPPGTWDYAATIAALLGLAVLASVLPALAAMRMDPSRALREG